MAAVNTMNELADFIHARLDGDAAHAIWLEQDWWPEVYDQATADAVCRFADRGRARRAIDAKRRLLSEYAMHYARMRELETQHHPISEADEAIKHAHSAPAGAVAVVTLLLRAVAAEYSNHPGCRPARRP